MKFSINRRYAQISLYVIITTAFILALAMTAYHIKEVVTFISDKAMTFFNIMTPVLIGFIISYLLSPLVSFYKHQLARLRFFKKRPRVQKLVGVNLAYLSMFVVIAAILSLLVSSVTSQLKVANFNDIANLYNNYSEAIQNFYSSLMDNLNRLNISSDQLATKIESFTGNVVGAMQAVANGIISSIGSFTGSLSNFFFALIISIYFSIDGESISLNLSKVFYALFSEATNTRTKSLIKDADKVFSGYIRGQLMDVFIMMVMISITLSVIGVKFALVIGILAGVANLVPYFGPIVAYVSTALVCLINGDYRQLAIAIVALVIIQFLDGNVIGPRLLSQQIHVHPLMVMIFLIIGGSLFGMLGMVLAVPVGAFLQMLFLRLVDERIRKKQSTPSQ